MDSLLARGRVFVDDLVDAFASRIDYALTTHVDHKTELQESLARSGRQVAYVVISAEGPPHGNGTLILTASELFHRGELRRLPRRRLGKAIDSFLDLREGDLRDTLVDVGSPVDFMLVDIWTPMARPALELVARRLRQGAVVIADNTEQYRDAYRDYFEFVNDPKNGLRTMTLPFKGGLEFTVRAH